MIFSLELNRQVTSTLIIEESRQEFQDHVHNCMAFMIECSQYIYVGY